jgi:clan AA aspartic protease
MMQGFVNQRCEAIIPIAVGSNNSKKQIVETLIDTGFTGFLSLPTSTIAALGLPWQFRDLGTLGDGSDAIFDMYKATVIWDGKYQIIDVAASEADPLIGMGLLYGFRVQIEAVEGGNVTIEALKSN